jgi:hypothetical protein
MHNQIVILQVQLVKPFSIKSSNLYHLLTIGRIIIIIIIIMEYPSLAILI